MPIQPNQRRLSHCGENLMPFLDHNAGNCIGKICQRKKSCRRMDMFAERMCACFCPFASFGTNKYLRPYVFPVRFRNVMQMFHVAIFSMGWNTPHIGMLIFCVGSKLNRLPENVHALNTFLNDFTLHFYWNISQYAGVVICHRKYAGASSDIVSGFTAPSPSLYLLLYPMSLLDGKLEQAKKLEGKNAPCNASIIDISVEIA